MASLNRRVRPPSALSNSVLPNDSDDDESELSDVESPSSSPIGRSRFTQIAEDDDDEDEDEDAEGEEDDEDAEGEEVDEDEDAEGEEEEEEDEDEDMDQDADNSPDDDDEEDYELEDEESAASTPVPTTTSRSRNRAAMSKPVPQSKSKAPPAPAPRSRRPPAPTSTSKSKPTIKAQVLPSSTAHRLTVKMPKEKLRDATSGWTSTNHSTEVSSSEVSTPRHPPGRRGQARAIVRKRRKVIEPSSDEEEEEEEEDEDVDMSDADADGIADDTMGAQQAVDDESSEENPFGSDDEDMEVLPIGIQSIVSGASTPDLAKLTKRQRGRIDELYSADLMELPNSGFGPSPANKLHLTADEQALKRTEMARRRRNLTVQKVEEEKMETVNRLLYRQPVKPKSKPKGDETPAGGDDGDVEMEGGVVEKAFEDSVKKDLPPNGFVRWTNRKEGSTLFVPTGCLQIPPGRLYGGPGYKIQVMDEEEAPTATT